MADTYEKNRKECEASLKSIQPLLNNYKKNKSAKEKH